MCVNSNDTTPIQLGNVIINPTDKYVYLGAPILNSEIEQQIELQLQQKQAHLLKFTSFLTKNCDSLFHVKRTVWDSALNTVTTLMWVTARYAHPAWRTPLQVRVYLYQYLL